MYFLKFLTVGALAFGASAKLHRDTRRDVILAQRRPEPNSTEPTTTLSQTTTSHITVEACTLTILSTSGRPLPNIQVLKTCEYTTTIITTIAEDQTRTTPLSSSSPTHSSPSPTHSSPSSTPPSTLTSTNSPESTHTTLLSSTGGSHNSTSHSYGPVSAPPEAIIAQSSETAFDDKIVDLPTSPLEPTTRSKGALSITVFPSAGPSAGPIPTNLRHSDPILTPSSEHSLSPSTSTSTSTSTSPGTSSSTAVAPVGIESFQTPETVLTPVDAVQSAPPSTTSSSSSGAYSHTVLPGFINSEPIALPSLPMATASPSSEPSTVPDIAGSLNTYQPSEDFLILGITADISTLPPSNPTTSMFSLSETQPLPSLASISAFLASSGVGVGVGIATQETETLLAAGQISSELISTPTTNVQISRTVLTPGLVESTLPPSQPTISRTYTQSVFHSGYQGITQQMIETELGSGQIGSELPPSTTESLHTQGPAPYLLDGQTSFMTSASPQVAASQVTQPVSFTTTQPLPPDPSLPQFSPMKSSINGPASALDAPSQPAILQPSSFARPVFGFSIPSSDVNSFTTANGPESVLIPHTTASPTTTSTTSIPSTTSQQPVTTPATTAISSSSTPSQQPASTSTTTTKPICTGLGGIIGAIGGFVDCSSAPTTNTFGSSTESSFLSSSCSADACSAAYQTPATGTILTDSLFSAIPSSSPIIPTTSPVLPTSSGAGVGGAGPTNSGDDGPSPTDSGDGGASPTNSVQGTTSGAGGAAPTSPVEGTTPGAGGAVPTTAVQGSTPGDGGAAPTSPVEGTTPGAGGAVPTTAVQGSAPGDGGAVPTNPIQVTTPADGGSVPTTAVQGTTPGDGGVAPTNPIQVTTPGDGGVAPTNPIQVTTPADGGSVPTTAVQGTTPGDGGVAPTNPIQVTTPTDGGSVPTTAVQGTTPGDGGVAPTNPIQVTTPTDGGSVPTTAVQGTTPGDGGVAPTNPVQGNTPLPSGTSPPDTPVSVPENTDLPAGTPAPATSSIPVGDATTEFPATGSAAAAAASSTTPPPGILIGSFTASQDANSNVIIGSQTLTPGAVATISGQQVSVNSGGAIIINGATDTANATDSGSAPTSAPGPAVVIVGGTSITADSASGFVIGNQTLFPGSAITTGGEVITLPLPSSTGPITAAATTTSAPIFVVGSSTFTEESQSDLVIGTQTLTPGGVLTVDGQVVSLSPTGNAVIVNGAAPSTFITETASIVPQSQISSLVIAGQTLTAGGQVTIGGDILSLAPSGTGIVVIGTVTVGGAGGPPSATATGKKKNAGGRITSSFVSVGLQVSFVIMVFWLH